MLNKNFDPAALQAAYGYHHPADQKPVLISPEKKVPPEPELADLYHVSRITVRRTVEELCTQGYLIKHQGKGTFVKSPMIFRKFESQKNMSFSESCRQNDRIPESHVLSFCKKPANSVTSDFLQLTSDEEAFFPGTSSSG